MVALWPSDREGQRRNLQISSTMLSLMKTGSKKKETEKPEDFLINIHFVIYMKFDQN